MATSIIAKSRGKEGKSKPRRLISGRSLFTGLSTLFKERLHLWFDLTSTGRRTTSLPHKYLSTMQIQKKRLIVDDRTQAFDPIASQQRPFIFLGWLQGTHSWLPNSTYLHLDFYLCFITNTKRNTAGLSAREHTPGRPTRPTSKYY